MTTALAKADDLNPERVALLKRTLCPDLSNDEMELFAGVARRTGLDPFAKQIYGIKRKGKLTIQTGIDGFRVIALRTGELDGQDGPFWCGADGAWRDVWLEKVPPAAAKIVVYRKGCARGFVGVARFAEYAQSYNGQLSDMWNRMGATMIAKCAEALALRKAFPQDLSGLYTSDEMEQAEAAETGIAVAVKTEPTKQLPVAKPTPKADDIDRTTDREVMAAAAAKQGRDPARDVKALLALAARKGWDWQGVIDSLNKKFKTLYDAGKTPWGDVAEAHRAVTVAVLNALPDVPARDSADELVQLCQRVAVATNRTPDVTFARYAAAAQLPDGCIRPADLNAEQLADACLSFRAKLDSLAVVEGSPE